MHVLYQYFGWPNGGIWSNVIAEPVIAALTLLVAGKWVRKAIASHKALHVKIDRLHESHAELHAKLDALKGDGQATP